MFDILTIYRQKKNILETVNADIIHVLAWGQGRPPCRVLKNPDQRKTNLSEKSALVNLLLCDFWIWFGF